MVTFKQFLAESESTAVIPIEDIAEMIKRDCGPWLKAAHGHQAWRGIKMVNQQGYVKQLGDGFYLGTVRTDRKPLDSKKWLHDTLNTYFKSKIGIPLRSTSLFVFGKKDYATNYGEPYRIFPIGNFNYAWSPLISDATNALQLTWTGDGGDEENEFHNSFNLVWEKHHTTLGIEQDRPTDFIETAFGGDNVFDRSYKAVSSAKWKQMVKLYLDEIDPYRFNKDLTKALNDYQTHEIMLVCDKYYAISDELASKLNSVLK